MTRLVLVVFSKDVTIILPSVPVALHSGTTRPSLIYLGTERALAFPKFSSSAVRIPTATVTQKRDRSWSRDEAERTAALYFLKTENPPLTSLAYWKINRHSCFIVGISFRAAMRCRAWAFRAQVIELCGPVPYIIGFWIRLSGFVNSSFRTYLLLAWMPL